MLTSAHISESRLVASLFQISYSAQFSLVRLRKRMPNMRDSFHLQSMHAIIPISGVSQLVLDRAEAEGWSMRPNGCLKLN